MDAIVVVHTPDGQGSGFFISPNLILTNAHVVGNWDSVRLTLKSGENHIGRVVASDLRRDLALVKTSYANLTTLQLGKTNEFSIGESVVAIGSPISQQWTVTKGIISQSRRDRGVELIQTDVAMNPGNSGGPLIATTNNRVVGVCASGINLSHGRPIQGISFAISADEIHEFLKEQKNEKYFSLSME